jgi:hypothetical protein
VNNTRIEPPERRHTPTTRNGIPDRGVLVVGVPPLPPVPECELETPRWLLQAVVAAIRGVLLLAVFVRVLVPDPA